jgi:hypothetical protein
MKCGYAQADMPARLWRTLGAAALACALTAGTLALAPASKAATTRTWTGNGDGSTWADANNWSGNAAPENGDSVVIGPTATQTRPSVTGMPGGTQLQDLTMTNSSLSGGDVTVSGDFSWSVASSFNTLGVALTVDGDATFSGAGEQDSTQPMVFDGNTDVEGPGLLSIQDVGTAVTNNGVLAMSPSAEMRATVCCATTDALVNTGTVTVPSSAAETAAFGFMKFENQGSLNVGAGSTLHVYGGPGDLSSASVIDGGGTVQFDMGAAITVATGVTLAAGSTVELTGNGEFFGPGGLKGSGKFTWSGGTIDGDFDVASAIRTTVSGTAKKSLMSPGKTLALLAFHGPVTVQDTGPLEAFGANISSSGTFTIMPGATVEASECCASPDLFTSTGTLTVPASTGGIAELDWLSFQDNGTVSVGAGSTLHVTVAPGAFGADVTISGGGTVEFDQSAQMKLSSKVSIGAGTTVLLTGEATFLGPGMLAGSGRFDWTGGTISGNVTVASTVSTTISGTATKSLTSPTKTPTSLILRGHTTVQDAGEVDLSGSTTLSNAGTMKLEPGTVIGASVCCAAPDHIRNSGTLQVLAGAGTATVANLAFSNTGTVKVSSGTLSIQTVGYKQTAGSTQLAGGAITAAMPMNIAGGKLTGYGTITGSVRNAGTVSPSTTGGVLTITGDYTQTRSGTLSTVISGTKPGKKFGQLSVGGTATLAGKLKVSAGHGFRPRRRATFTVLVCQARAGKFHSASGSPAYAVLYGRSSVRVKYR